MAFCVWINGDESFGMSNKESKVGTGGLIMVNRQ